VLNFQDFHPQELTDVCALKNKFVIRLLKLIEAQSYKNADYITVLSEGGIDYVVSRGGNPSKIKHIYNGSSIEESYKYSTKKNFKSVHDIEDKFLISYAGILSPFQGLDNILDAAKELINHREVMFYIAGDGIIRDHLASRIIEEQIANVRLLPFLKREDYFNLINSSDISIVSLDSRMKAPCLPGKLINLTGLGRPIIAVVSDDSETSRIIKKYKIGYVVKPDDAKAFRDIILELKNNPSELSIMGLKGQQFFRDKMQLNKNLII
jgi:glycosyltransferase involved in cell wall biosynthesis